MNYALLPGILLLLVVVAITVCFLAAVPLWKLRLLWNSKASLTTPADWWLYALTRCPCLTLIFGILLPCSFGLVGAAASGFSVNVNLDFSEYLEAELEEQYLLNVATEASLRQVRKPFSTELQEQFEGWTADRYENRLGGNVQPDNLAPRGLYEGVPLIFRLWSLDIFYEAVDQEKGIFTEEALNEIRDFENQLVSFSGYSTFCRRWDSFGELPCDAPSSVKNLFFTMPNSSRDSTTMELVYDGTGKLASIDLALEELARNEVRWWTESDFNSKKLKSQYTRSTFYGGAPLIGYSTWHDRQAEQEAKIHDFLGRLFRDYLRGADVPSSDPIHLPYKHVKFAWYEKRMHSYEVLYYLWYDMLFAFGTLTMVTLMVLMRFQNVFITFFAAIGVLLAFVATYYFHFVAGFTSLSILDFVAFFVIMGIAADDVFLMYNAYQLAARVVGNADPKEKMKWAFKEASAAMLVTSVTTCGSFYANSFSVIKVVRSFGFFMASVVAWNFVNVLTIFPSAILVNDLYIMPCLHRRARGPAAYVPSKLHDKKMEAKLSRQELGCIGGGKCLSPCISTLRWFLLVSSLLISIISLILGVQSFRVSEGEIQIFEEDLNLGRLQKLRKEIFPDSPGDYEKAIEVNPPGRTVRIDACPGQVNDTWCSGQGMCDTTTSSCLCDDGFVGQGCSVDRANGSIQLVYLSAPDILAAQVEDVDFVHAHVLSSPTLTEVPADAQPGRADFFMLNHGDDPVSWELAASPEASWLTFSSTMGTVPPRSFSRTDQSYLGRGTFVASMDLSRKPFAWEGTTTLRVSSPNGAEDVSMTALVVPPASLTELVVSEWNSAATPVPVQPVRLQPPFSISYGFSANVSENLLLKDLYITYQVEVQSPEILLQVTAIPQHRVLMDGLPRSSAFLALPEVTRRIPIQVLSAFQSTTYILEASRKCDWPCTTTTLTTTSATQSTVPGATTRTITSTSSTWTTTKEYDTVVGIMTLNVLNCPALQSVEGQVALERSMADIAQVDPKAAMVDLWCGRRLGVDERRLQVVGAELRYSIVVEQFASSAVVQKLTMENEQSMTQKLQASVDGTSLVVQLKVLSLEEPEVNPDSTTTVTVSSTRRTLTSTSSLTTTLSITSSDSTVTSTLASATSLTTSTSRSITSTGSTSTVPATSSKTSSFTVSSTSRSSSRTSTSSEFTPVTSVTSTVTSKSSTVTTVTTVTIVTGTTSVSSSSSTFTTAATVTATATIQETTQATSSQGTEGTTGTTGTTGTGATTRGTIGTTDPGTAVTSTSPSSVTSLTTTSVQSESTSTGNASDTANETNESTSSSTTSTSTSTSTSRTTSSTSTTSTTSSTSTKSVTSYTTTTHTTSSITATFLEGFDYISGQVEILVSDCAVQSDLGREVMRQSIAQAAEVNASYITVDIQCEAAGVGRRLQLTVAYASYGIQFPPERSEELFPGAMVKLETQQASLQASLDTALAGTGLVMLVQNMEVVSGPPPTTSSTSSTTLCPGMPTCMGKGRCEQTTTWQCVCEETYSGVDCSNRICPSCQNNASCLEGTQDLESLWGCDCSEAFFGANCELLQCPGDCNGGGDCNNVTGHCTCLIGFKGADCSVKDVPLTNAIEIILVFGLKGYQALNRSAPEFDRSLKLLDPVAQEHLLSACSEARATLDLRVKDEMPCWIDSFKTFMTARGGHFPVSDMGMMSEALQAFLYTTSSKDLGYRRDVLTTGETFDGELIFTRLRMKVNMAINAEKSERRDLRERWEDYVRQLNARAPRETGWAMMVSKTWTSMELEDRVFSSTIAAFSLSILTSLVAVSLFTRNVLLAFYVCCTILLVVCVLSGCLLNFLQYDFGVAEAIGATVFVGLSVDYCLHLAHGYYHADGQRRGDKLQHALIVLTPSILGGAITTIAACAFLLPCRMILFRKLGWTLMLNAVISIIYTFTFLAPSFDCRSNGHVLRNWS